MPAAVRFLSCEPLLGPLELDLKGIHWVIVGGESGPKHRPIEADWVRSIRGQAETAEVAFFFKQWGGRHPKAGGRELDGRTHEGMPPEHSFGGTWTEDKLARVRGYLGAYTTIFTSNERGKAYDLLSRVKLTDLLVTVAP